MKKNPIRFVLNRMFDFLTPERRRDGEQIEAAEMIAINEILNKRKGSKPNRKKEMRKNWGTLLVAGIMVLGIIVAPIAFAIDETPKTPEMSEKPENEAQSASPIPESADRTLNSDLNRLIYGNAVEYPELAEYEIDDVFAKAEAHHKALEGSEEDTISEEDQQTESETKKESNEEAKEDVKKEAKEESKKEDEEDSKKETKEAKASKDKSGDKEKDKDDDPIEVKSLVKLSGDDREKRDPPTESEIVKVMSYEVTAYTHTGQKTSRGKWPEVGTIAVNTDQIAYGTLLYVEGYGYGVAGDTGGFRHSGKKQIDLFMNSESECVKWGRKRNVRVFIIAND